jgi:hypothetical protein
LKLKIYINILIIHFFFFFFLPCFLGSLNGF